MTFPPHGRTPIYRNNEGMGSLVSILKAMGLRLAVQPISPTAEISA